MARYIDADALSIYFDALTKHAETEGLYNMAHVYERCLRIVKDAPTADVVSRAEVAREIFAEIREKGSFSDPCVLHIVLSFEELAEIEKKYTEAKPPKEKQPKNLENFEKKRLLAGDCFHGEIWYRCPYCFTGIEAYSIPKDRICHKCGKEYL